MWSSEFQEFLTGAELALVDVGARRKRAAVTVNDRYVDLFICVEAIQRLAESAKFSVVREYCGHGIGREFHEEPQVLHYGNPGTGLELQPGMTFTIEPMINAGKRHVKLLPDNWTVVTKDRSLSAQWEHTILVTESAHEVLTARAEERFGIAA